MKLLLVEDYEALRASLTQGLREEGFVVDASGDGEEGLWFAQGNDYDVIVLDLMLPGLPGLELLRRLREGGSDTHVLILTARDAVEDRVAGLDAGADDYLVKPFAFEELLARIHALARRRYGRKTPRIEVDDRLVLTTDGLLEARDEGGTMLEDSGFDSLLEAVGSLDAGQTARRLAWAVRTREGENPQDDLTVVVVRRVPGDDPDHPDRPDQATSDRQGG